MNWKRADLWCAAENPADAEWEHLDDDLVPFIVVSTIK